MALKILGNVEDAEEAAQEACLKIFEGKAKRVRFAVIDAIRLQQGRTGKKINSFKRSVKRGETDFVLKTQFDELSPDFKMRLKRLKLVDRILATLYFVHGFNLKELGKIGAVTEGFISVKLSEIEKILNEG